MRAALAAAAAAASLNLAAGGVPRAAFPPAAPVSLSGEGVVASVSLWSLGMRRLAADLGFVRLLIYYGTYEAEGEEETLEQGGGKYPEVLGRARRILAIDPFWTYPVVYGASALAFNLQRPDESLTLLDAALASRPGDAKLLALVGAVGFHKNGDLARAVDQLMPAVESPDAPTMLKHMAAFMNERLGRRDVAVVLYREILQARDKSYEEWARRGLKRLGQSVPD